MQWLCDGILQKYWVKPVKRKGIVHQPPNNPDQKSMHRFGTATVTIEPHSFDAIFYSVREPATTQSFPRHPNQHTTKAMLPPLASPAPQGVYTPPPAPYQRPPSAQATTPGPGTPNIAPQHSSAPITTATQNRPSPVPQQASNPPSHPAPPMRQEAAPASTSTTAAPQGPAQTPSSIAQNQSHPPTPTGKPSTPIPAKSSTPDPVIQMLAARAASDSRLKELMQVVAVSKATPEQLKEFQAHIDEFNQVIRRQEAERIAKVEERSVNRAPSTPAGPPQLDGSTKLKPEVKPVTPKPPTPVQVPNPLAPPSVLPTAPAPTHTPAQPVSLPGVMHTFPPRPMAGYMARPPPPPPRPEALIKHIVLEITSIPSATQSACTDRWLFPANAVLEIHPSGFEMLCSFLVERKGSGDLADKEFYQPMTMTIKVPQHKTIATIAQAAKPLPTVQAYMKDVMEKKERAPVEYLVHQLPREKAPGEAMENSTPAFVDSGVELGSDSSVEDEEDELKDVYGL